MRFPWLMILPVVMLFSCSNRQYVNTYTGRIDSLSRVLEEEASAFETLDTAQISLMLQSVSQQMLMTDSTGNKSDSLAVEMLKTLQMTYADFTETVPAIYHEIAYTRTQLADFKYDLQNGRFSADEASFFYERERQSVHILRLKMAYYTRLAKANNQKYLLLINVINNVNDSVLK